MQQSFTLRLNARDDGQGEKALGMLFDGDDVGESSYLKCVIENFQDIKQIVMEEGVADIYSLEFQFEQNH